MTLLAPLFANCLAEGLGAVSPLPREVEFGTPGVPVGGGRRVDRAVQAPIDCRPTQPFGAEGLNQQRDGTRHADRLSDLDFDLCREDRLRRCSFRGFDPRSRLSPEINQHAEPR